jgi:hypothetical protein
VESPLICEIKWIRVNGGSEFVAMTRAPDGTETTLARSPRFRWRLPLAPDATPGASAAHKDLVGRLLAAGWRPYGRAGLLNWYADRFRAPETSAAQPRTGTDD